ncbi:hypothetical protein KC909_02060 [Candidatus Dojkabacteria bacterium]|uniref:YCII-related domain-containing protein n=1 Tax=Candidatus Dojkabacteria bacterium TaxID=2099670 RepID=A0A955RIQ0_9BACT|nr:hypothetical protein [Candidatus Dojkabacteria bacterium]
MKQFMILIMGTGEGMAALPEEERNAHMSKWYKWDQELVEKGIKISGEALKADSSKVISGKNKDIKDGFFSHDKDVVIGGYYLIKADDINSAVEIAKGCPTFELEGNVEVREVMVLEQE